MGELVDCGSVISVILNNILIGKIFTIRIIKQKFWYLFFLLLPWCSPAHTPPQEEAPLVFLFSPLEEWRLDLGEICFWQVNYTQYFWGIGVKWILTIKTLPEHLYIYTSEFKILKNKYPLSLVKCKGFSSWHNLNASFLISKLI